jgi:PAS domain S-box-containing protein
MSSEDKQPTGNGELGELRTPFARALLDSALDCIITIDAAGRIREFNTAAEQTFGFSRSEVVGQELAELIVPPRMRKQHRQGLTHYLQTGEGPLLGKRIEIAALRRDGSEILAELSITPFQIDGAPFFTAYLRDITERVRRDRNRTTQYAVASLLATSWTLEEIGSQILEAIALSGDGWIFAAIWLYDNNVRALRCRTTWCAASQGLEKFADFSRSINLSIGEGLPGRVWDAKNPAWIEDVTVDPNFPRAGVAAQVNLRGGFAFPLFAKDSINGIIELFTDKPVQPDDDFIQMAEAVGIEIGLFLARWRLEQKFQEAVGNTASLPQINTPRKSGPRSAKVTADTKK